MSGAIGPALGDAFLTSAITATSLRSRRARREVAHRTATAGQPLAVGRLTARRTRRRMRSRRREHHGLEEARHEAASCGGETLRDGDERVECGERAAGVDRLAGERDAFGEVGGLARGEQRGRGVEHDDVAARADLAAEHAAHDRGVLGSVATGDVGERAARDADGLGRDLVGAHVAGLGVELGDRRRAAAGDLVHARDGR